MLRRFCLKHILYHLRKQTIKIQLQDFPATCAPELRNLQYCRCIQSSSHLRSVKNHFVEKPETVKGKAEFLQKYPGAFRYEGEFAIKVQPFSINAPVYLGNFINDLGHTLKIPYVYEDGYSAAMCLEKICKSRDKGSLLENTLEEGITREEWHEIFLAINDEVIYLNGRTTVSLISLSFRVEGFRKNLLEKLILRFQSLVMGTISIKTLCSWSDILQENEAYNLQYVDLLEMIWKKILSNRGHIAASDLLTVYQALPARLSHLFPDFYKDFERNLPELKVYDLFMIGMELEQKSERTNEFKLMVGWLQKNLHLIRTEDLEAIIMNFHSAGYVDGFLLNVLSQHVRKLRRRGLVVDKHFMEVTLNYSTLSCFYDENILEIACDMFIESKDCYTHNEMEILLKAIGTLNHTPRRSWEFFNKKCYLKEDFDSFKVNVTSRSNVKKMTLSGAKVILLEGKTVSSTLVVLGQPFKFCMVEEYMHREAFMLKPETLLDFTVYLLYVDRPLFNLRDFIFSATFQGLIRDMKDEDPETFRKCLKHLHLVGQAFLEIGFDPFPRLELPERDVYQRLTSVEYKEESVYSDVATALRQLISDSKMGHFPRPTFDENYIEIQTNAEGTVLETRHPNEILNERCRKAIIILGDDDYCSTMGNAVSDHMLGSQQVNINILKNQRVDVFIIPTKEIYQLKRNNMLHKHLETILNEKPTFVPIIRREQFNESDHSRRSRSFGGMDGESELSYADFDDDFDDYSVEENFFDLDDDDDFNDKDSFTRK